ncbi:hypothetical protein F2Q68_00021641 [Brassica cretica]|uniref:Uncharacterized protein n=1 Tax=Brassica cretica TaxID=69181 RepID=A0A8S9FP33_BRACR|nr:hypothetical protein F2Q68_00021641 [Brassica cretica]
MKLQLMFLRSSSCSSEAALPPISGSQPRASHHRCHVQGRTHAFRGRRKLNLSGGIHSLSPVSSSQALQKKSED